MAACSLDLQFQYTVGWEGSTADMKVLSWALESGGFSVPEGKYYLVDSGYANTDKFLAPYRYHRYHLSEFLNRRCNRYSGPNELFNHRHAQLRNVIECAFGVPKMCFKWLRCTPYYSFRAQTRIALACCILHNFIRREEGSDILFNMSQDEMDGVGDVRDEGNINLANEDIVGGDQMRTMIIGQLWGGGGRNITEG
ncbi:hypothetical protein QJS04_geneDACA000892 [Acorus gramineus]|uniref:DDE Tnp4 domain-containing protein n=1 Tax=Acorus gramineus TaxID=55184 RepID=A0AAV9AC06_ACOGR|nr:hypothetical protein QJS04_geneDACA000892 [Acorus gramineus]